MNKDANLVNERWLSGMSVLCTRIETERYIFDDAIHSKYHQSETTAFCKGVSLGLHLACTMLEGTYNSIYENCCDTFVSDLENVHGGDENV